MKKSTLLFAIAALLLLPGCSQQIHAQTNASSGATRTEIKPVLLENYFLKNTVKLKADVNLLVAQDSAAFNKQFGVARTMGNKIVTPDFSKNTIAAIACKSTDVATTIAVERIISNASSVDIYVKITRSEKQNFTSTPLAIIALPKLSKGTIVNVVKGEWAVASTRL